MEIKKRVLLNPGPANTTRSVKEAQVVADICPREKEFGLVMEFISNGLTEFVGCRDKYASILFGGSGTAAVESIISSVVDDKTILIINNGAYGERMCKIAEIYNLNYIEFKSSTIEKIDLNKLEYIIKENKDEIGYLAIVHHETTTGLLNDIKSVGALCKKYNIEMIVDAMSSFAGIPIDMEEMNIKYLASSSNKCIQGMAGVSFVIANKGSLNKIEHIKKRNLYLNLYDQYMFFSKNYQMRFTPPVQVLYALKQAIIEAKEETIEKRNERYRRCCKVLWEGLDTLELKRLLKDENSSRLLTTIIEPDIQKYNFNEMHDYLDKRGFTIYPGKIASKNTFRIANIGDIDEEDIREFLINLNNYFKEL